MGLSPEGKSLGGKSPKGEAQREKPKGEKPKGRSPEGRSPMGEAYVQPSLKKYGTCSKFSLRFSFQSIFTIFIYLDRADEQGKSSH